jgi:hypothetical protein
MKVIVFLIELFGWVKIVLSPTLAAALISGIVLYNKQDEIGLMIAASLIFFGFIIGIVWATYVWKKYGNTTSFLSGVSASPELNKKE